MPELLWYGRLFANTLRRSVSSTLFLSDAHYDAAWESYTSISKVRERLEGGWNDDDEEALGTGTFRSYSAYGNGAVG